MKQFLILARVSNFPSIISNVTAVFAIGSISTWFAWMAYPAIGMLYLAGMMMNDYCDRHYDAKHQTFRPIPSGMVSVESALKWILILNITALALALISGWQTAALCLLLVAIVIAYNVVHKKTKYAFILMAGARFAVYPLAAAFLGISVEIILPLAFGMFCYIAGLSLAPRIPKGGWIQYASPALLAMPLLICLTFGTGSLLLSLSAAVYMPWVIRYIIIIFQKNIDKGMGGLLAGISLVDCLLVSALFAVQWPVLLVFFLLFLGSTQAQKFIPAN